MDFWSLVGVVVRRWYVVIPMLLGVASVSAAVYLTSPPQYTSQATVVLAMTPTGGTAYPRGYVPAPSNPLLLDGRRGVALATAVLEQTMQTESFLDRILEPGTTTELTVTNRGEGDYQVVTGPFLMLSAQSDSADDAQRVLQRAVAEARVELPRRQAALGAPEGTFVVIEEVVSPTTPRSDRRTGSRPAAAVAGIGVIMSVAAAFVIEGVVDSRRRRVTDGGMTRTRR